jgi:hypothetical protein
MVGNGSAAHGRFGRTVYVAVPSTPLRDNRAGVKARPPPGRPRQAQRALSRPSKPGVYGWE